MKKTDPLHPHSSPSRPGSSEKLAASFGLLWLVLGGAALLYMPGQVGLPGVAVPVVLFALIWRQARALRRLRDEADELRRTLAAMAQGPQAAAAPPAARPEPRAAAKPRPAPAPDAAPAEEPATTIFGVRSSSAAARMQETAAAPAAAAASPAFASRRDAVQPAAAQGQQASLDFEPAPAPPPLTVGDFLLALNFPQDPDDTDGFRALRLALKSPQAAPLVRAAQDVLTLMSQNGLYMDDLVPDHPRPELWRRFAAGERGGALVALGGVRDAAALANCAAALREDPVFRDAVHHFLRHFDLMLTARAESLDDAALIRLAETRTARAFMLLGRSVGIFD
ncbi:hypothetical protein [Poseidonocella sp. HB161398]|uniref:hypothetical protein n=1 Tax=Poseidonocella sp. HB161398 TaxID=2320855 RepID=UPI001109E891|nr:hypothetical protein [Poseidonocella sp. HB161398]